jgi:hypothetical protein
MNEAIIRVQLKSPLETIYSFVRLPGVKEKQSFESVYSQIKGIDFSGPRTRWWFCNEQSASDLIPGFAESARIADHAYKPAT